MQLITHMSGSGGMNSFLAYCDRLMGSSQGWSAFNHAICQVRGSPFHEWSNCHMEPANVLTFASLSLFLFPCSQLRITF